MPHDDEFAMSGKTWENSPPDWKYKLHVQFVVPAVTNNGSSLTLLHHMKQSKCRSTLMILFQCILHFLQPFQYQAFGVQAQIIHHKVVLSDFVGHGIWNLIDF